MAYDVTGADLGGTQAGHHGAMGAGLVSANFASMPIQVCLGNLGMNRRQSSFALLARQNRESSHRFIKLIAKMHASSIKGGLADIGYFFGLPGCLKWLAVWRTSRAPLGCRSSPLDFIRTAEELDHVVDLRTTKITALAQRLIYRRVVWTPSAHWQDLTVAPQADCRVWQSRFRRKNQLHGWP